MGTPKGTVPWNAGTGKGWLDKRGYRWVRVKEDGRTRARREHRVIMEKHLDRRLEPWEAVHHIDGNTQNNKIENLEVVEFGKHTSNHHFGAQRPDAAKHTMAVFGQMKAEVKHWRAVNADLLAALENAIEPFNQPTRNPGGMPVGEPEWCSKARAAIAKARGPQAGSSYLNKSLRTVEQAVRDSEGKS